MADNRRMILNLFGGMQDALFLGDRFANGEFVSFLQPGQFVSLNLQENDGSDDMAIQAEISNILVDSSYVNKYRDVSYSGGTELLGSVNQVYEDILNRAALPYKKLPPDIVGEIAALEKWLIGATPNYELYRDRYFDADEAYEFEAHKQYPNPARLRRLQQLKTDAAKAWEFAGAKSTYEKKFGRLLYLTAEDPSTFWARLRQRLADQQAVAPKLGPYYQTFLVPPIASWSGAGWETFERTISETDTYNYSKSTSWSGGLSANWGLISFGGGASGSTKYQYDKSSASNVYLKFDYLRVRIYRPWLVDDVFGYRFWTWRSDFGCDQSISDGGNLSINPPLRPIGRMPILPKYLIVIRNLELSATFSSTESTFYSTQLKTNASIGYGPFSLSGSYEESTQTKHVKASFDGVTFRLAQPQIIARTGIMLPRCPNPDKTLSWQGDQCFPDENARNLKSTALRRARDYAISLKEELLMIRRQEAAGLVENVLDQGEAEVDRLAEAAYQAQVAGIDGERGEGEGGGAEP